MAHHPAHPAQSHAGAAVVDINPPGAEHGQHHGHTIVPMRVLVLTLATLLFFTLATVGAAQLEKYISHTFAVEIPQWVNVVVALSIAAVKTAIVAMFFMQLRYDSPVNSLVLFFTIVTVSLFLGFTMIDLGNRSTIYPYKGQYVVAGGSGNVTRVSPYIQDEKTGSRDRAVPAGTSVPDDVRKENLQRLQATIASGGQLTQGLTDFHNHMIEELEELTAEEQPVPAYITEYAKFLDEQIKLIIAANKPLPPILSAYADMLKKEHNSIPPAGMRSSPNRSRVRSGFSPDMAPPGAGHGAHDGAHAEPAKDKPAH